VNLGLYGLVFNSYKNPVRVAFYVAGMIAIGFHLIHATHSMFQTFGVNHPFYNRVIRRVGIALALAITIGFASIPFYLHFCGGATACSVSSLY
jgi:succinate dehydrogenase / fumarate reductase cytochrome b subunit